MTNEDRFMEAINAQIEADNQRRNADLDAEIQKMTPEEQLRFIFKEQKYTKKNAHNWLLRERLFETIVYKNLERFAQILGVYEIALLAVPSIGEEEAMKMAIEMKLTMYDEPTGEMLERFRETEEKLPMTFEEYEAISDKHGEKFELLNYWEGKLDEVERLAREVETDRMAEKDGENCEKFFEMLWEARNFAEKHVKELDREVDELADIMATPEYRAMEKAVIEAA